MSGKESAAPKFGVVEAKRETGPWSEDIAVGPLSPAALGPAVADLAEHAAAAPDYVADVAQAAVQQGLRSFENGWRPSPEKDDHRFVDPAWQVPPFSYFANNFLLIEDWLNSAILHTPGVSERHAKLAAFAARQWLDAFSPSNLPWTNPEVLRATVREGGMNFVRGFSHWLEDLHREVDPKAVLAADEFVVGRDVAVTPGKVVLRNDLIELIQYAPQTSQTRPEPLLIVPAWIMKYYILDLSPENSLIRWLVGQGYTVFAISWRNPGAELRDLSLDDYRTKGVLAALEAVGAVRPAAKVHAVGYCLGGTLLSIAAAAMARDGDDRLGSLTLFASQTDFTEAGELQLFITEDQLDFLDDLMTAQGYLDSRQMAGAFQLLRSNDLIWSRAVRNYLLGQREHPSDLMAWNADGTRMPARMHTEYLHRLFLNNDLAEGRLPAGEAPVSLADMRLPMFVVGTETDHIAPWRSVYKLHLLNDGELTFVLTSGGHNAGVVSEPGHPGRHFRLARRRHGDRYLAPEEWVAANPPREGSWWPAWSAWLGERSGSPVPPPGFGAAGLRPLDDAPGRYVHAH